MRISEPGMADKPKEAVSIKGSCLCRSIQYELRGAPFANILCHCDNCRKACGSPFAAGSKYAKDQLSVTHGQNLLRMFDDAHTDSGSVIHRAFCGTCGSSLFVTHSVYVDIVSVAMGSMEGQQSAWRPEQELYCKRRLEFLPKVEGTVCHGE